MKKVVILLVAAAILLAAPVFAMFEESFEYDNWAQMSAAVDGAGQKWIAGTGTGWNTVGDTTVRFVDNPAPADGFRVIQFEGQYNAFVRKVLAADLTDASVTFKWYYPGTENAQDDNYASRFVLRNQAITQYLILNPHYNSTLYPGKRTLKVGWNATSGANYADKGVFVAGWNDVKVVYHSRTPAGSGVVTVYLNGTQIDQRTGWGKLGCVELGRNNSGTRYPQHDASFDKLKVSEDFIITPSGINVPTRGIQRFKFTSPDTVTWEITAGVGSIDSAGIFTAGTTPGTSTIKATDTSGNTDEIVVNVVNPVIDPYSPTSVVLGKTETFTYLPSPIVEYTSTPNPFTPVYATVNWAVQNESGGAGSVGTIDSASGVFTATGLGTCEVTATDSAGNTAVAQVTVVGQGTHRYEPDINTLALYHLDEGSGLTWYDSGPNSLNGTTQAPPLYHLPGPHGNAVSGFGSASHISVPATTALNAEELTAEAWVCYAPGSDPQANDTTPVAQGGPAQNVHGFLCRRGSQNTWSFVFGGPFGGAGGKGSLTFAWWQPGSTSVTEGVGSANLNLATGQWYHVAVTFKRIANSVPATYEVKLYCTPAGSTTPVEVASKTTTMPLKESPDWLKIGWEANATRFFPGYIDEVRISSRARTPEELSWTLGQYSGKVADPQITPAGGVHAFPLNVSISCATEGATIYYTTDGIDPTRSSKVYNGTPISVGPNMTVKAMAYKAGLISSYAKATYTLPNLPNRPQVILYSDAVSVDGNMTDWADAEWVPLDQVYNVDNSTAAALQADIPEAYYAAKWGENGNKVYVALRVKDTYPMLLDNYDTWNTRDAAEFYIHTTGAGNQLYQTQEVPKLTSAQQYVAGFTSGSIFGVVDVWESLGGGAPIISEDSFKVAGTMQYVQDFTYWLTYEAAITPYHSFSFDGTGTNQISTLSAGQIIGLDVVAVGNNGSSYTGQKAENTLTGKWDNYTKFAPHMLMTAAASKSIVEAKTAANGSFVSVSGIVSAIFTDYFYVESADRTYGIRVNKASHGRAVGEAVTVTGYISTLPSTERYILAVSVSVNGGGQIDPLGMTNKSLGGGDYGTLPNGQCGVIGGAGTNNIGLLVKTTGKVSTKGTNWFMIDDGSGVGVKVYGTVPSATPYVSVKGISSCEKDGSNAVQRVLLATEILENAQ